MMVTRRIASMMSLCMKAGKMQTGETAAEYLLRSGSARLVIVAADASENTQKKFVNKCFYYKIPVFVFGGRNFLSGCVGKSNRTVFTVTDDGFADHIARLIGETQADTENEEGSD